MSEHTPLTEAEREALAKALGCEFHDADYGECAACASHAEQVWDDAIESIVAARTSTADTEGCWQPCDPDCEVGPVHCEAVHLPSHKARTVLHTAECVAATADTGLRERVRDGLTRGMHLHHDGEHWVRLGYVLDLLDATAANTKEEL